MGKLLTTFDHIMMAVTFAEAGESKTALDLMAQNKNKSLELHGGKTVDPVHLVAGKTVANPV